ncbi:MAG: SAM-dependent methyltransferase [Parachlamydiaceae bacterium]
MDINGLLTDVINEAFVSATLSSPSDSTVDSILKITLRPLSIKTKPMYQATEYFSQKVTHTNLSAEACCDYIRTALQRFRQAVFTTSTANYHLLINKRGETTVIKKQQSAVQSPLHLHTHNREKIYILPEGTPIPFLVKLGIMSSEGKVLSKKYDKFRQINRFLEMVRDVVDHLPKNVKVIDFGCGKAYLTFALYYYLRHVEHRVVDMVGIDLKKEVIAYCQKVAEELGCAGLSFIVGDINHYHGDADLVVSLHACDTATDAALEKAIQWNARVILCVPCCQHELYSQIQCAALAPLLRHGILRERFAALATDAARAELLTAAGYDVDVLEFIDMEHTPKNLLLRAIKANTPSKKQAQAKERYIPFKQLLQIEPSLEKRLKEKKRRQSPFIDESSSICI